jgi:hypothetical protein
MKEYVCESCGSRNTPERITKGSLNIELVLWLFLLLPGFLYGLWRLATRTYACRRCQGNAVPMASAKGRMALQRFGTTAANGTAL